MKKFLLILLPFMPFFSSAQWFDVTPNLDAELVFSDFHILDEDIIYFFGTHINTINNYRTGLVLKTIDGGQSWDYTQIYYEDTDEQDYGPSIRGADMFNESFYAMTCNDGDVVIFFEDSLYYSNVCAFCDINDITILQDSAIVLGANHLTTYDLGVNWNSIYTIGLLDNKPFFRNEDTVVYTSTEEFNLTEDTYQKIHLSTNKGLSFTETNLLTNNRKLKDVLYKNNNIYAVGEGGCFVKVDAELSSYDEINTTTNLDLYNIAVASQNNWFVCGGFFESNSIQNGIILGTSDAGGNWQSSTFPMVIRKIKMYDPYIGYAISEEKIYKTTNSGGIDIFSLNEKKTERIPYPNPASTVLHTGSQEEKHIYNLQGQMLWQGNDEKVNVSQWEQGIYLLKNQGKVYRWMKN